MNTKGLSLNSIPPLFIPLRFFLSAPLFGVLAAFLILFQGPDIWGSRWNPNVLALTHLFTLGFMLMIMMGALYQFIPVMMGQLIPGSKKLVPIIHPLLIMGTITLCAGFLLTINFFYWVALISLSIALGLFALSLLSMLVKVIENNLIVFLLRVLFFVLVITIGLGLYMLLAYVYPELNIAYRQFTDIHALWGLIAWVVLLIMAVSSQVIPMFYVTAPFSLRYLKLLSLMIVITMTLISLMKYYFISDHLIVVRNLIYSLFTIELIFFILYTMNLIRSRKRKLPDATINFFRVSFLSLFICVIVWWMYFKWAVTYSNVYEIQIEFTLAILLIYGLALSAILGMLQKIVPFLIFLNLQQLSFKHPASISLVPNMKKIISTRFSQIQLKLHISSLLLLIVSVYLSQIVWLAGLFVLFNFLWLGFSLLKSVIIYKKTQIKILAYTDEKL